jgi:hypothetical protein
VSVYTDSRTAPLYRVLVRRGRHTVCLASGRSIDEVWRVYTEARRSSVVRGTPRPCILENTPEGSWRSVTP